MDEEKTVSETENTIPEQTDETVSQSSLDEMISKAKEEAGRKDYENEYNVKLVRPAPVPVDDDEEVKKSSFIFDIVSIVSSAAVLTAIAFMILFRTVGVVGSSMFPTLKDGDRVILSACLAEPKNGDIVVTCQPSKVDYIESTLVKRVIATEGQTIDIDFEQGLVCVDGEWLEEPYVNELVHDRESFEGPLTIPEGYVFVMGDNRNASTDSRDQRVGLIRKDYVMGKVLIRIKPFGQFKIGE